MTYLSAIALVFCRLPDWAASGDIYRSDSAQQQRGSGRWPWLGRAKEEEPPARVCGHLSEPEVMSRIGATTLRGKSF